MRYKFTPVNKGEWEVNSGKKDDKLCAEVKQLSNEFPELFERNGRIKNPPVKINLKSDSKITQQKGRRIPTQLQNAADAEIRRF